MADILDLAKSIMAQKAQASQGYSSPLEKLPLQVAQIMDTRAKEKRVSLKSDSVLLSNLIKGATTEEEIANARQLTDKYYTDSSKHDQTKLYGEAINQQFNSKQAAYNQFKSSAEWLDNQINNRADEKGLDSTDYGLSQINDKTWDGLANEKFGKNVSQLSDIENIEMMAMISKGGSDKHQSTRGWNEWSTVQNNSDKTFKDMIANTGFDSVANKYNISEDVINKINTSFDNDEDKSQALAVIIAESGGDSSAVNYNYGDKVKGASYFKMSSQEMQNLSLGEIEERRKELENISGGFEAGQQFGFKYNKGKSSYVTLQNEYADYKQRLEDTYKAHVTGDKITGEEAMAIMLGDYEGTKKIALKQTSEKLRQLNTQYTRLAKLNVDNIASDGTDVLLQGMEDGKISENSTETELKKYINEEADKVYRQILAQEKRQFLWSGISNEGGSEELGNIITGGGTTTGGVTGGGATTSPNQIVSIDRQKTEVPSTPIPVKPKTIKSSKVLSSKIEIPKGDAQIEAFFNSSVEPPKDPISKTIKVDMEDVSLPKITRYKNSFMYYEPEQKTWVKWDGKKAKFNGKSVPVFEVRGKRVAYYNDKKGEWIKLKSSSYDKFKLSSGASQGLQDIFEFPPIMSQEERESSKEETSKYRDVFGKLLQSYQGKK